MRFSHGLLFTGMTLLGARPLEAHPESAVERAALDALIAEVPDNAELYLRRAEHRAERREWPAAEADLQRAAKLAPDLAAVKVAAGRIYLAADRLEEARAQLDAALAREIGNAEALVLRARVRARLGEIAAAHADYSAALGLIAEPSPGLFLERSDLPIASLAALRGLDEGLARIGPAAVLLERAIALELRLGRIDAAVARLDTLATGCERQETLLKRRGDILALAGRKAEACAAYTAARVAIEALPPALHDAPETVRLGITLMGLIAATAQTSS